MPRVAKGCVEQLPSGSWRARVYAGIDPITKREIRLKATTKTEQQAHIELGRLLKEASEGRTPESGAMMAKLLDEYAAIAPWDVSTRQTNEGFIRRTIKQLVGHEQARAAVQAKKKDGYDVIKLSEFLTPDLVKAVTDEAHHVQVVADEQIGQVELLLEHAQQVQHLRLHRLVERGYRLVEDHHPRLDCQCARDVHALLLAA